LYRDPNGPQSSFPPSINSSTGARTTAAPSVPANNPTVRGGGDQANSLVAFLDNAGVTPENQGQHIVNIGKEITARTGRPFDANAPLNLQDNNVRSVLAGWTRANAANAPPPQAVAPQPQQTAQAPVAPAPVAPAPQTTGGPQTPIVPTPVQTQSFRAPERQDPSLGGLISQEELRAFGGTPQGVLAAYMKRLNIGLPPEIQKEVQSRVDAIRTALQPTGEIKNAQASGFNSPLEYDVTKANTTELGKQDIDTFNKRNAPIQAAAQMSYDGQGKAKLMKQLTLDPNFYSGPLSENVQTYNQFKSVFGQNPSAALPQEAFNKVAADMLTEQIKAMGNSGVGRVLMAEVNNMKKSLAGLGITASTNRALAELISRNYDKMQKLGEIANNIPQVPGQMNREYDRQAQAYLKANPLFTKEELQNPKLLGAPDAPPQSANWSVDQRRQWAASIGLKPGDDIRFNGRPVKVP
jgi:hypothetical protein